MNTINKKRDYTRFFTYPETAEFMANLLNPKPGQVILEPSAGNGSLVKAVKGKCPQAKVFAVELYPEWKKDLEKVADIAIIKDFLEFTEMQPKYSGCIANPPFGNGTDLSAHIDKMIRLCKKGAKLVILVPKDYYPDFDHTTHPLINWSKNSDGTTTEIKIIEFTKR